MVEDGADAVGADDVECGRGGFVAMADLDGDADGGGGFGDGDPIEAVGDELGGEKLIVGADGDGVGVGMDVEDVERVR